jgi:hypothetical protein
VQTKQIEYFSGLIKLIPENDNLGYLSLHLHTSLLPETNNNYYPEVSVPGIQDIRSIKTTTDSNPTSSICLKFQWKFQPYFNASEMSWQGFSRIFVPS